MNHDKQITNLELYQKVRELTTDNYEPELKEIVIKAIKKYRSLDNNTYIDIVLTKVDHIGIDIKSGKYNSSEMIDYITLFPYIKKELTISKIKKFLN